MYRADQPPSPITETFFLCRAPTGCPCLAAGIRYFAGKSFRAGWEVGTALGTRCLQQPGQ